MSYSYVSLLTNDSYVYGIALLVESMKRVKTKYPLFVLVTNKVSAATLAILRQLNVSYATVDTIETPKDIYEHNLKYNPAVATTWRNCWTKLWVFDLQTFDKVIFLDADIMLLKNIDHLFECPHMTAALDGEYFNIWPDYPHFNNGCVVIEPSHKLFNNLLEFANNLKVEELPEYIIADQEIVNLYYKDWYEQKELHLNKYYNVFAPYTPEEAVEDIKKNAYFIHFIGRKPWTFWIKNPAETYSEYFYEQGKKQVEECISRLDWESIRSELVLTVYAICKDEINHVRDWVKCFSAADHVCVLDTGSTDGTWEELQKLQKEYPNLIVDRKIVKPWRYDKARNLSMELIPKDTTINFMVDLDELIHQDDWVAQIKGVWDPLFDRGIYDYHRDVDIETGAILRTIKEYRVHSNDWYTWINIVHEALINHQGNKQFYVETCTPMAIEVYHYSDHKANNYLELCEEDLKEYPEDWVMRLQLIVEYEVREQFDKAMEHSQYIITRENTLQPFELARCYNCVGKYWYMQKDFRKAEWYFTQGRLVCPAFTDNYIEAMEMYYNIQNYNAVIELGKQVFQNCPVADWCSVYDVNTYYPHWLLGLAHFQKKDFITALGYFEIAYSKNKSDEIQAMVNSAIEQSMLMLKGNIN